MATTRDVFDLLHRYLGAQAGVGTLHELQRAVLAKSQAAFEREGHWPIVDFPLAIHRQLNGASEPGRAIAAACLLFYSFADVIDDAQDHDLSADPWDRWGWEQAVNTGTSLLFLSLQALHDLLPRDQVGPVAEIFVRAGLAMTAGQHVDLIGQGGQIPGVQEYLHMIEGKSGASFGAYAAATAALNGQPSHRIKDFAEMGRALGGLFQMVNDTYELWDARYSPDYANRRLSLPLVLAYEQLQGVLREAFLNLLSEPPSLELQYDLVMLLERGGIKEYATLRIEVYRKRALALAQQLGVAGDPYLKRLLEIPAFPETPVAI